MDYTFIDNSHENYVQDVISEYQVVTIGESASLILSTYLLGNETNSGYNEAPL